MAKPTVACIVSTPYHVLTLDSILSMPEYLNTDVDIYVIGSVIRSQVVHLRNHRNVREILDYSNCFVKKFTKLKRIRAFRSVSMVHDIFSYKRHIKRCGEKRDYNELLIPHPSIPVQVMVDFIRNNNKRITINSFEDGVGTYLFGSLRHRITHYVFTLVFRFDIWELISTVYVYRPELVQNNNKNHFKLIKIVPQIQSGFVKELLKEHSDDLQVFNNIKVIFFDQYMMGDYPEQLKRELDIVSEICRIVGEEKVVMKIHPRTPVDRLPLCNVPISLSRLPFEVLMQSIDIKNIILISPCSTACLTPKILLNEEPNVALISTITGEKLGQDWDVLVNNVRSLYDDKERFATPSFMNELLVWLKDIVERYE